MSTVTLVTTREYFTSDSNYFNKNNKYGKI